MSGPRPALRARFVLDPAGRPEFSDNNGLKHYRIELFVANAPPSAESVVYRLDESYYNPSREVLRDVQLSFPELISSYGDFEIKAAIGGSSRAELEPVSLADALRMTLEEAPDGDLEAIQEALARISGK